MTLEVTQDPSTVTTISPEVKEAALAATKEAARLSREARSVAMKATASEKEAKKVALLEERTTAKAAKLAASEARKAAALLKQGEKEAKPPRAVAHGVTRPSANTKILRTWEIADELSAAAKAPAGRGDVMAIAAAEGLNAATAATQYSRWRVFNGLKGLSTTGQPLPIPLEARVEGEPVATL